MTKIKVYILIDMDMNIIPMYKEKNNLNYNKISSTIALQRHQKYINLQKIKNAEKKKTKHYMLNSKMLGCKVCSLSNFEVYNAFYRLRAIKNDIILLFGKHKHQTVTTSSEKSGNKTAKNMILCFLGP